jgi:hypothetical protein
MAKLINFINFQLIWFLSIYGAAAQREFITLPLCLIFLAVNLFLSKNLMADLTLILQGVILGIFIDTSLIHLGVISFKSQYWSQISPVWMWVIWAGLLSTVNSSMSWLKSRQVMAGFLGLIFAPLSYWAGVRIGAGVFNNLNSALITIGSIWLLITSLMMRMASRIS